MVHSNHGRANSNVEFFDVGITCPILDINPSINKGDGGPIVLTGAEKGDFTVVGEASSRARPEMQRISPDFLLDPS